MNSIGASGTGVWWRKWGVVCGLLLGLLCWGGGVRGQGWTPVASLPRLPFVSVGRLGPVLYAATDSTLFYVSRDGGASWQVSRIGSGTIILSVGEFQGRLYAGTTTAGIFSSADTGRTWQPTGPNFRYAVSFAAHGGQFFAASQGWGVARLDARTQAWSPVTGGLPNYSFNVDKLVSTGVSLLAAAGANGTFYRYDPAAGWGEEFFRGNLAPGLAVMDMVFDRGTLLGVTGRQVLRSEDDGASWVMDAVGLRTGVYQWMALGSRHQYVVTNRVPDATWVQRRGRGEPAGSSWALGEELLPGVFTYGIWEDTNRLYLATSGGVLYQQLSPTGMDRSPAGTEGLRLDYRRELGTLRLEGPVEGAWVAVYTVQGRLVRAGRPVDGELEVGPLPAGVYVARIRTGQRVVVRRVVAGVF